MRVQRGGKAKEGGEGMRGTQTCKEIRMYKPNIHIQTYAYERV